MVVYLIDGHALCYRAFYAIRELRNSRGFMTNVVYGFAVLLRKIMKDFHPDGLAVTFDMKAPTFRHKKFEAYKIHRKPMPEDLVIQMPVVRKVVEAHRIPIFEKEGYEADDVIGTMARTIAENGHKAVILTGDKDAFQLVSEKVKIMNPGKDYMIFEPRDVKKHFGVMPSQVTDVLALMGDASDGVPGVPRVGQKTALELIREFGSLEDLYKNLDKLKVDSRKRLLEENREQAMLSRELVTIDCAAPISFTMKDLELKEPDTTELRKLYKELEFRSLLQELPGGAESARKKKFELIQTRKAWSDFLEGLRKEKAFAFDFETTSINALVAEPVGLSLAFRPHEAAFVLFNAHHSKASALEAREVLESLKGIFEDGGIGKIGQNLKYEMTILRRYGIRLKGMFDTMVGSYLLNPAKPNHNLADVAMEHLDEKIISIEDLIGKGKKQLSMADVPVARLVEYGCQDSDVAFRLAHILEKKIEERHMTQLFREIEMPLVEVISDMECQGISIDKRLLSKLSGEMAASLEKLSGKIYKIAKKEFNINSPKQLAEVLFHDLALPIVRRTKTGPSTDMEVLTELSEFHDLPKVIIQFRELSKLKSTYVDTMPGMVLPETGRVHSSFNQTVTATGRLSSNDPNLQNIPVRTEEGRKIRKAFVAAKDFILLSADYSQIELRVLAHLSQDKTLQRAFHEGQDVHTYTAALIFGISPEEVTAQMRDSAKTVNFGVLYGMSPFGLSRSLRISQDAARDFIRSYFERYPDVRRFLDETVEGARKRGYVETLFKRRRYIPDILVKDPRVRQFAERTAINAPVQGTASDIIKIAMVSIYRELEAFPYKARMIIQVHDELVFEVEERGLKDLATLVKQGMEKACRLDVSIEVALKAGPNWLDMEPVRGL